MIFTYAITVAIAIILLIGYCALVHKKEPWLLLLYICVAIVNSGYFLLSISKTLEFAIFANNLAYFGSVFLTVSMLLTIVRLCGFTVGRKLVAALIGMALLMFALVATSGFLPWYYKEISLTFVDGAAKLEKEYGVLHPVYMIYLLGYFAAMIACVIRSTRKRMIASQKHAALIAIIVFGNISVWFVEKFIPWDFEFLSVSYLFSEIVLLGLYWMMQDYVKSNLIPQSAQEAPRTTPVDITAMPMEEKIRKILSFLKTGERLATREREILERILENKKRKEIADELCLSENTIKTYTRALYGKLGVSSREELYALLLK